MSNVRGCLTCARRRVVCDGASPTCKKCTKRGLECLKPGVRSTYRVRFHGDQEALVPQTKSTGGNARAPPPASSAPSLTRAVAVSASDLARTLFVECDPCILGGSGAADPVLRFIKPALQSSAPDSLVREAVDVVAMSAFAVSQQRSEIFGLAARRHVKLIRSVRARIAAVSPTSPSSPDTLMAVFLLCLYEYITSQTPDTNSFIQHIIGTGTLAAHCKMDTFVDTEMGQTFLHGARLQSISLSLFLSMPMSPVAHPDGWCAGLDYSERGQVHRLLLKLTTLRATSAYAHAIAPSQQRTNLIKSVISQAEALDRAMVAIPQPGSDELLPIDVVDASFEIDANDLDGLGKLDVWPGPVYVYKDLLSSSNHTVYLIGRTVCLAVIVRCLNTLMSTEANGPLAAGRAASFYRSLEQLHLTVAQTCANIPYNLGVQAAHLPRGMEHLSTLPLDGRGALYLWNPLLFAVCVEGIPEAQRQWLLGRLRHLGDRLGVKIAKVWLEIAQPCLIFAGEDNLTAIFGRLSGFPNLRPAADREGSSRETSLEAKTGTPSASSETTDATASSHEASYIASAGHTSAGKTPRTVQPVAPPKNRPPKTRPPKTKPATQAAETGDEEDERWILNSYIG